LRELSGASIISKRAEFIPERYQNTLETESL
jgi:hypothetical protein